MEFDTTALLDEQIAGLKAMAILLRNQPIRVQSAKADQKIQVSSELSLVRSGRHLTRARLILRKE